MAESTPVTPFNECEHTPAILDLMSSSKCGKTGHCHIESYYTESKQVQTLDEASISTGRYIIHQDTDNWQCFSKNISQLG